MIATVKALAVLLVVSLLPGLVIGNDYLLSQTQRLEFVARVTDPDTFVTVRAKATAGGRFLEFVSLSYDGTEVFVPNRVLRAAQNPRIHSLELAFCTQADEPQPVHPCLMLFLEYGKAFEEAGAEPRWPYLAIDIIDGRVASYTEWRYDGAEWVTNDVTL